MPKELHFADLTSVQTEQENRQLTGNMLTPALATAPSPEILAIFLSSETLQMLMTLGCWDLMN